MRHPALPAIAAALFFLLPCTAGAQEDAEAVYAKFHRAMQTGNFDDIKKYSTADRAAELDKIPADQRAGMLGFVAMLLPPTYKITGRQPSPDGTSIAFRAIAAIPTLPGAKPEQANGDIQMVKQGGAWKVKESSWKNADPSIDAGRPVQNLTPAPNASQRQAATVKATPAPKAPVRVMGPAKEPCVYKSVMTNEDMERCR